MEIWRERETLLEPNLVSEMGFVRIALAHRNMWFGKKNDGKARDEESLIPGCPRGHPWYGASTVLLSFTRGETYR